jgi:hypothetical protein
VVVVVVFVGGRDLLEQSLCLEVWIYLETEVSRAVGCLVAVLEKKTNYQQSLKLKSLSRRWRGSQRGPRAHLQTSPLLSVLLPLDQLPAN